MCTSDSELCRRNAKTALIYLLLTIFCALFGAVYELLSCEVYSFFMLYQPVNVYLKLLTNPKKKENFEAGVFLKIGEYTETHQGVVCRILWVEQNEKTLQIPVQKDEKIELKPGSSYRFLLKNDIVIGWEEEQ